MSVNIENSEEPTVNGNERNVESNEIKDLSYIEESLPEDHDKPYISTIIDRSKPTFLTDILWDEYQKTFPWLYHTEGKFRCSFCEESFKGDRGMSWSIPTIQDKSKNISDDSTKYFDVSDIRLERHNASQNHSLACVIRYESDKTIDDWLSLKDKYDWLEGDIDNTRCSLCEQAYQKNKQAMLVTIWTCPDLRKQQSSTTHFSTAHKLDRHVKCNNHLLAVSLKSADFDNHSSGLIRPQRARPLSRTDFSQNNKRSKSASNSPITRPSTQPTLSPHKTRLYSTRLSSASRSLRRRSFSPLTQTSINSLSPDKAHLQSAHLSPVSRLSQSITRSQRARQSSLPLLSTQPCISPINKPSKQTASTITLSTQEIQNSKTAQQSQDTIISSNTSKTQIATLSPCPTVSIKDVESPKVKPSIAKHCRSSNTVLPLAISSQLFKKMKFRFPWVNSRDTTSLMCEQCREPNSHILFELNSSLSLISRKILGHLNSEIHQHSTRNDILDISEKAPRSARGPKIDYKRLSSGKEAVVSSVGPWSCPQCKLNFAHMVGLIHHVSVCDRQSSEERRQLDCPCDHGPPNLFTIAEVDLHVAREHSDQTFFHCHLCSDRYCRLLTLYEHVLVHHLVEWDPFAPPPPPPTECLFCHTSIATNVLLNEHYRRSACRKRLQPVVLIERMLSHDNVQLPSGIEIIKLIKDDGAVPQQNQSTVKSLKKEERSIFSQMSSEIIATMKSSKEHSLIEVSQDVQSNQVSLPEVPQSKESPDEPLLKEISSSEPLTESSSKEELLSMEEASPEKLVEKRFEIVLLDCVNGDPSALEKMAHPINASEDVIDDGSVKPARRGRPKKIDKTIIHDSDSSKKVKKSKVSTSLNSGPKVHGRIARESMVSILNRKRHRVPSEKLMDSLDSVVKPVDPTKRIRVPSEKLRESFYNDTESLDSDRRVRTPTSKLKVIIDSPVKTKRKRRSMSEMKTAEQLSLYKTLKRSDSAQTVATSVIGVEKKKSKSATFEEALNYVQTTKRSTRKSLKVAKLIKRPKEVDLQADERKLEIAKSIAAASPMPDTPVKPPSVSVTDCTPTETARSRKPVIIQSQVSPLSMQMIGDLTDSELIPSTLSFMDRMKRIRQLKKLRSQQQREQMMAVDQTVAEIREHGDSSCLKSKEIKRLLTCEQYSMDDLKSILHKQSRKRRLDDSADYRPSKRSKLDATKLRGLIACDLCAEKFPSQRSRDKHAGSAHRGSKMFKCQSCGVSRATHSILRKHVLRCHKEDASYALYGEDDHVDIDLSFQCHFCTQLLTSKAGLNVHMARSHRLVTNKHTPVLDNLEPNLSPSPANDEFVNKLKEADPVNIGQLCPVCNDVMNNEFELAVHVIEHERDKGSVADDLRFACPECCRLFFGKEGKMYLKDHYNIIHLQKPLPSCDECDTDFPSTWCYYEHKRVSRNCSTKTGTTAAPLVDPYEPLNDENRLAFVCNRCQCLVAGESAQLRFEAHLAQCGGQQGTDDSVDQPIDV